MPLTKNQKIIAAVAVIGVAGAAVVAGVVIANKNKSKPKPQPTPDPLPSSTPFFTSPEKLVKIASGQQAIVVTKPKDIKDVGTVEFDFVPKWSGLPGGSGQPLIRIGEYPMCFEIYQSGGDVGVIAFRVGGDAASDKYEPIRWKPEANKSYHIMITWSKKNAALYIDGVKFTFVTGLDMAKFTSHNVLVFPPTTNDAEYTNIALYDKAL